LRIQSPGPSLIVTIVAESLRATREEIEYASEHAERSVRQQLRSINEGLEEQLDGDKTESEAPPKRTPSGNSKTSWLG
jgi:hypothetical protein